MELFDLLNARTLVQACSTTLLMATVLLLLNCDAHVFQCGDEECSITDSDPIRSLGPRCTVASDSITVGLPTRMDLQSHHEVGIVSRGGDKFAINLYSVTGGNIITAAITDHHNGSYTAEFTPQVTGVYRLCAILLSRSPKPESLQGEGFSVEQMVKHRPCLLQKVASVKPDGVSVVSRITVTKASKRGPSGEARCRHGDARGQ